MYSRTATIVIVTLSHNPDIFHPILIQIYDRNHCNIAEAWNLQTLSPLQATLPSTFHPLPLHSSPLNKLICKVSYLLQKSDKGSVYSPVFSSGIFGGLRGKQDQDIRRLHKVQHDCIFYLFLFSTIAYLISNLR